MDETYKVVFAPRAMRDLEMLVRHISVQSDAEIAIRFGTALVNKALSLSSFPERGRVVPEVGEPFREIIFRSYRIVYRVTTGLVEIICFWHASRGIPQIDSDDFGKTN
ncbi:MAG TPA: type II toxin-antitoxin system RelE/ParE family toxin [Verrucomicrobiae bacterium]|jgi:plasmid stabilization system protein ParE|nr:type II toxin-antitoxin system RelE/ParE family toxin [Verrucomicrobiae bacterium]